jgi:hypothetical protein
MPTFGTLNRSIWVVGSGILLLAIVLAVWIGQGQTPVQGAATSTSFFSTSASSTSFSPTSASSTVGSSVHIEVVASGLDLSVDGVQLNLQHSSAIAISNVVCEGEFAGTFRVGPTAIPGGSLMGCVIIGGSISQSDGVVMSFDISSTVPVSETITFGSGVAQTTTYTTDGAAIAPGTLNSLDVSFVGTVSEIVGTIQLQNQTPTPGEITLTLSPGGQTTTTDGNGDFSFPGLAQGTYSVLAEQVGFLSAQKTGISVSAGQIDIGVTELRSGDVNRDGAITIQDISTVASNFGTGGIQPW